MGVKKASRYGAIRATISERVTLQHGQIGHREVVGAVRVEDDLHE
jgi:hypothetical protein